jgi:hypothetical protein
VYRRFTRVDEGRIPRHCTFSRNFAPLGPHVTIHGFGAEEPSLGGVMAMDGHVAAATHA